VQAETTMVLLVYCKLIAVLCCAVLCCAVLCCAVQAETTMVLSVYRKLIALFPDIKSRPSVGIISPYKGQVMLAYRTFQPLHCHRIVLEGIRDAR
jgi:hypothetical protein